MAWENAEKKRKRNKGGQSDWQIGWDAQWNGDDKASCLVDEIDNGARSSHGLESDDVYIMRCLVTHNEDRSATPPSSVNTIVARSHSGAARMKVPPRTPPPYNSAVNAAPAVPTHLATDEEGSCASNTMQYLCLHSYRWQIVWRANGAKSYGFKLEKKLSILVRWTYANGGNVVLIV